MTSLRHNPRPETGTVTGPIGPTDQRFLDAAKECILAVGWRRTTLTDVAKRAGVSRMTIYRRWPDMAGLLADLMLREWGELIAFSAEVSETAGDGPALTRFAKGAATMAAALRDNEFFGRIIEVDPELLLPYLVERRGRSQDLLLGVLEPAISAGQADGSIRTGDPTLLARSVLLAMHGFVLSGPTMTDPGGPTLEQLDAELVTLVERYLRP